ncbi:hypothetical protein [Paenibacillus sp. Soil766]|uniref:hypothetical protein n=1 Tax=Paenibacillus sp. Soil766 TaxID=1736404 RepID=UPI000A470424|nr:hypothetical protein [Paenibacillus sp. Soil766]
MENHDISDGYKQTAPMLRKLAADKTGMIKEIEQHENDKCLESILGKQDELSILQADRANH